MRPFRSGRTERERQIIGWVQLDTDGDNSDPEYTVTQQIYDAGTDAWQDGKSPRLVSADAIEVGGYVDGATGEYAFMWRERDDTGFPRNFIWCPDHHRIRFGKATETASIHPFISEWTVAVHPCLDIYGTTPTPGITHTIQLPSNDLQDPAVYEDTVVAYVNDGSNAYSAVWCPMAEKIGYIKPWWDSSNVPAGWQIADGTNGTRNMSGAGTGKFLRHVSSGENVGDSGGATQAIPSYSTDLASLGSGSQVVIGIGNVNTVPPYLACVWIQRTS